MTTDEIAWAIAGIGATLVVAAIVYVVQAADSKRSQDRLVKVFASASGAMTQEYRQSLAELARQLLDPALETDDLYLLDPQDVRHAALLSKRNRARLKMAFAAEGIPRERWREEAFKLNTKMYGPSMEEAVTELKEAAAELDAAGHKAEAEELRRVAEAVAARAQLTNPPPQFSPPPPGQQT